MCSQVIIFTLPLNIYGEILNKNENFRQLTSEESRVIQDKGTEKPFINEYNYFFKDGVYTCKRCGNHLFKSSDKFQSSSGWPSFDGEIAGAVKMDLDSDGGRTELTCSNCRAHLGHVFRGEGFTSRDIRYCVNSISLLFIASEEGVESAYFAGGCFWGIEYFFKKHKGVISAKSGFMGGERKDPSYREVVLGGTGHIETVKVEYDSTILTFEDLAKLFFEIHDPTQTNGKGPDIGEQYLSVVFYNNKDEKEIVERLIDLLETKGYKIATGVRKAKKFWEAEEYHQDYYMNSGKKPYCHLYEKRF